MTLSFSQITLEDVGKLMAIENACHSHPWTEKTFASCIGGRYFGEYAQSNIEDKEQLIGFYIGEYLLGEATLMDICVPPQLQGNGYGRKLLEQFISESKKLGAEKIFLEVRASNISAQMLYINHGFIEISRRTGYYPKEVGYEDAIVMVKEL